MAKDQRSKNEHLVNVITKASGDPLKNLRKTPMSEITAKKCFNCCPNCGASDPEIDWGRKEWAADICYQEATCNICSCEFKEYYQYADTEFIINDVPRVPAPYPMNMFYCYLDEVREGDRVSTPEDCEGCTEKNRDGSECDMRHCMIESAGDGTITKIYGYYYVYCNECQKLIAKCSTSQEAVDAKCNVEGHGRITVGRLWYFKNYPEIDTEGWETWQKEK